MNNVIEAHELKRSFRRRERASGLVSALKSFVRPHYLVKDAVESMSFSVERGACLGVIGANGAGKTTLLKMAAGLLHPSSGSLEVLGFSPSERNPNFLKRIGMVMGQKSQLWIDIPARDTFDLLAAIYDIPRDVYLQRLHELAEFFGVQSYLGVQVRRLSLGERMRLEIMAALLHDPELLFLDEPTIGLDLLAKENIRHLIRTYNNEKGTTILLTSHDMEDIQELCESLMIIAKGHLKYYGKLRAFEHQSTEFKTRIMETLRE